MNSICCPSPTYFLLFTLAFSPSLPLPWVRPSVSLCVDSGNSVLSKFQSFCTQCLLPSENSSRLIILKQSHDLIISVVKNLRWFSNRCRMKSKFPSLTLNPCPPQLVLIYISRYIFTTNSPSPSSEAAKPHCPHSSLPTHLYICVDSQCLAPSPLLLTMPFPGVLSLLLHLPKLYLPSTA